MVTFPFTIILLIGWYWAVLDRGGCPWVLGWLRGEQACTVSFLWALRRSTK